MKIFISHSWKDKTAAQQIADALKSTTEVWLDLEQLFPGQKIQDSIDKAMQQMDLMILLWSRDSASSSNVAAEVACAAKLGVDILPCQLDGTRMDANPNLAGRLSIDGTDSKMGLFRIQIAVLRKQGVATGDPDTAALNDLKSYEGALNYVNDYRNKRGLSGEDSTYWALKSLEATNRSFDSLSKWKDQVGGLLQIMQSTMAKMQEVGNDRARLEEILSELKRSQYRDSPEMGQLLAFVEGKIASLGPAPPPAAAEAPATFEGVIAAMSHTIKAADRGPLNALLPRLQTLMQPAVAAGYLDALRYYIESSPLILQEFVAAVDAGYSASLLRVANELFRYLVDPNGLIPDASNGLLGFLDDAWLINNTIYRCIEAQLVSVQQFSADWNTIILGDQLALQLFEPQIKTALDGMLMQHLTLIAQEMQQYQPALNSGGAFMGQGEAVGGGTREKTIDDCYYVIGGKGYWMT